MRCRAAEPIPVSSMTTYVLLTLREMSSQVIGAQPIAGAVPTSPGCLFLAETTWPAIASGSALTWGNPRLSPTGGVRIHRKAETAGRWRP